MQLDKVYHCITLNILKCRFSKIRDPNFANFTRNLIRKIWGLALIRRVQFFFPYQPVLSLREPPMTHPYHSSYITTPSYSTMYTVSPSSPNPPMNELLQTSKRILRDLAKLNKASQQYLKIVYAKIFEKLEKLKENLKEESAEENEDEPHEEAT